jgi:hypothetical protein
LRQPIVNGNRSMLTMRSPSTSRTSRRGVDNDRQFIRLMGGFPEPTLTAKPSHGPHTTDFARVWPRSRCSLGFCMGLLPDAGGACPPELREARDQRRCFEAHSLALVAGGMPAIARSKWTPSITTARAIRIARTRRTPRLGASVDAPERMHHVSAPQR